MTVIFLSLSLSLFVCVCVSLLVTHTQHILFTGTILFLQSTSRSFAHDLFEYSPSDQKVKCLLTANEILQGTEEELSAEEKAKRERMRESSTGIVSYSLAGDHVLIRLSSRLFVVNRKTKETIELPQGSFPNDPTFSPDQTKVACVRDGRISVIDLKSMKETVITDCASDTITTGH